MQQPLDYAGPTTSRRPPASVRTWPLWLFLGTALLFMVIQWLNTPLGRASETANRIKCSTNLRLLGQACLVYMRSDPARRFPDSWGSLYLSTAGDTDAFLCPSSRDTRATGTSEEIAAAVRAKPAVKGGCVSYQYVGNGLTAASPPNAIVAYEPVFNHEAGGNVLYADCSVQWHDAKSVAKIIAALNAGQNPPP